jgi:hypothetical protein
MLRQGLTPHDVVAPLQRVLRGDGAELGTGPD